MTRCWYLRTSRSNAALSPRWTRCTSSWSARWEDWSSAMPCRHSWMSALAFQPGGWDNGVAGKVPHAPPWGRHLRQSNAPWMILRSHTAADGATNPEGKLAGLASLCPRAWLVERGADGVAV